MAPPYNTPGLQLEEMALDSVTPDEADVFLLSSTRFAHESTSFLDCVIEGNGRNEGTVHFITYRALHAGRTALIGQNLIAVSRPLLSSDWSESDSSIQPLYGKFHALSRVSAGRWGVTRER